MFTSDNTECSTRISIVSQNKFDMWVSKQPLFIKNWCLSNNFKGAIGEILKIPYSDGRLREVLLGEGLSSNLTAVSIFSSSNKGNYFLYTKFADSKDLEIQKAWAWGARKNEKKDPFNLLYVNDKQNLDYLNVYEQSINFSRELINSPANAINPETFLKKVRGSKLFSKFFFTNYTKKEISKRFPLTFAVGRSSNIAPKFIQVSNKKISKKDKPLIIIGKGVTFDTGGVNIKPGNSMRNMKKDMGGAAIAISLFLISSYLLKKTKIILLIPLAENSVSSNAMRPGDIYKSYGGKKVEISHTDAEGRLLLADAIELANELNPSMIIDFATLTGAARVALGEEIPAYFCNDEKIAKSIDTLNNKKLRCWRLPLYQDYKKKLKSEVANLCNASLDGMAGAITASLFIQDFLYPSNLPWIHFDTYAWSNGSILGTKGGALQGLDIMIEFIDKKFS